MPNTATAPYPARRAPSAWGLPIGLGLVALWVGTTVAWLAQPSLPHWAVCVGGLLLQTHLYTGLFITAHDAMHGTVHPHPGINRWVGRVAAILFAFNAYDRLVPLHHAHHRHVATPHQDPDYHTGNARFWPWYVGFALRYIRWWQVLAMAIAFNVLKLWVPTPQLLVFWIAPSVLSTLQLFYFGTYLPHRGTHHPANPHRARSQRWGHALGFLTCYFFGYHYEHHHRPGVPWWRLWREPQPPAGNA